MNKVYDIVKDRMLKKLVDAQESGERFAFVKPWDGGCPYACSYMTEKPYRGINRVLLPPGEYVTFKHICDLQKRNPDVRLKKGSSSHPVFFFKFQDKDFQDDEKGEGALKRRAPIFRYYRVFSIEDVEGVETRFGYEPIYHTLNADMEAALAAFDGYAVRAGLAVEHVAGSSRAYYSPDRHAIHLPDRNQFRSMYDYLSICFHEAVHSTGLALGRDMPVAKGSKAYAAEELVAEIGAAMLCAKYRIVDDRTEANSAAYLQSWIEFLSEETGAAIVSAASKAQRACDLICGELELEESTEAA